MGPDYLIAFREKLHLEDVHLEGVDCICNYLQWGVTKLTAPGKCVPGWDRMIARKARSEWYEQSELETKIMYLRTSSS